MTDATDAKEQRVIEDAKRFIEIDKERLLDGSFQPSFTFYTDDEADVPRLILLPQMDGSQETRQKIPWALSLISASIDNLEAIAFSVDTYMAKGKFSEDGKPAMTKLDGSEWGPGGMQYAWENNTPDKVLITESYSYQIAYNDGTWAMINLPYVRDEEAGTIEFLWDEAVPHVTGGEENEGKGVGGYFPESMFRALTMTKMMDSAKAAGLDMSPEDFGMELWQARLHTMAVAVKMVMRETQWPCMIPARTEDEMEIIDHSFKGGPFSEGIRVYGDDDITEIQQLEDAFEQPAVGTAEWLQGLHKEV